MNQAPRSSGNRNAQKRFISVLLIGFALLILTVVLLRRFLEPYVGSLSGTAKWASQVFIVGTAIYALFVPPYDKELRRLSRAGYVMIVSLLIAFGAFALSDWKDRVAGKNAEDARKDQIQRLTTINNDQRTTLDNQTMELNEIREVAVQQAKASSALAEQARAQDQLIKDAQSLLKGQGTQLERQARTLIEVGRAQELLLGEIQATPEIEMPYDNRLIKPWLDRLQSLGIRFDSSLQIQPLARFLNDAQLRPKTDIEGERRAAVLFSDERGKVDVGVSLRFYAKGRKPKPFIRFSENDDSDLSLYVSGKAELYLLKVGASPPQLSGTVHDELKTTILGKTPKMASARDFAGATVLADLSINNEVYSFTLSRVFIFSQNRRLTIEGFKAVRRHVGAFQATIPPTAVWK